MYFQLKVYVGMKEFALLPYNSLQFFFFFLLVFFFFFKIFFFLCTGSLVFPDGIYNFVDVRDVAHAHIQAFETPAANGRYCLVGSVIHHSETCKILYKLYHLSFHLSEK
jgi:hypothetical protein